MAINPTKFPNGIQAPLLDKTGSEIAVLTDNSGGSASDTIAEITGTYNETVIQNAIASLAAKVNALLDRS